MPQKTIGEYSEFTLIDQITKKFADLKKRGTIINIGDDGAVFSSKLHTAHVTSIDSFVENVHWDSRKTNFYDIGWKSVNAAVSDIAAMGSKGTYITIACNLKNDMLHVEFIKLINGIHDACVKLKISVIGGNLSNSKTTTITVTAMGTIPTKNNHILSMQRNKAHIGDKIIVSGQIGGAGAGFQLSKKKDIDEKKLLQIFHKPHARTDIAERLAYSGVQCAIDISDGLLQDLLHICHASQVNATIHREQIPLFKESIKIFGLLQAQEIALTAGEDYELLFTANDTVIKKIKRKKIPFYIIGTIDSKKIEKKAVNISLVNDKNITKITKNSGWEHFGHE
jgi:thiamine-monophosphate kinase|tara:strand:+ start:2392 stop:3405 length:1014 start_codon:yes stop_codon:yes gene_type:complete